MRIPHTIYSNTLKAYDIPLNIYIRNEQIKSDCFYWDHGFIKSLRELCLKTISQNWEKLPLYNELSVPADKSFLIEILPADLPLELTVPVVEDDSYWQRCYFYRWPGSPPPNRYLPHGKRNLETQIESPIQKEDENNIDHINEKYGIINNEFNDQERHLPDNDKRHTFTKRPSSKYFKISESYLHVTDSNDDIANLPLDIPLLKTWKQSFLERYLQEELEKMKPDMFNPEYIKELTDLYGCYIVSLNLRQLKSSTSEENTNHISLHSLLARLPNMIEFSVCFNQANLGDNFSWHATKVSETDCELLGNGVEKSNIEILRILRSNIDCNNLKLIIRSLCTHKTLRVLDLSHCKIADDGALAIAGMLKKNPLIETVILVNNKIGPVGAQGIAFYLCQEDSRLIELNLKLNPLQTEGGKFIATALARGAKTLRNLSLAACDMTSENLHIGNALALNTSLQKLDLSNNHLREDTGQCFLQGLETNTTLIHLDLRMCDISDDTMQEIETLVRRNLKLHSGIYSNNLL